MCFYGNIKKIILTVIIEIHSKLIFGYSFHVTIGRTCKLVNISNSMKVLKSSLLVKICMVYKLYNIMYCIYVLYVLYFETFLVEQPA